MKLAPRTSARIQPSNPGRRAAFVLLSLSVSAVVMLLLLPDGHLWLGFPSWRNVSLYQIVKMHLSPRPSHVAQVIACPSRRPAGVQRSDLNTDHIQFYEQQRQKFASSQPGQEWRTAFMPALGRENKLSLLLIYGVFKYALDSAGLEHIVMHGSALGAWRHHGLTPWDDDLDTAVHVKDWLKVKLALSCIQGYTLDVSSNSKWSFYESQGQVTQDGVKGWPFVDIFLYSDDHRYIWSLNYIHLRKFVFPREDVFPVQSAPFECFMVSAVI